MKKIKDVLSGTQITRILVKELMEADTLEKIDLEYSEKGYKRVSYTETDSVNPFGGTIVRIVYDIEK